MRGTSYARGPNAVIYRTIRGGTTLVDVPSGSRFDSTSTPRCRNNSILVSDVIEAIPVLDLSNLVPPFTVE